MVQFYLSSFEEQLEAMAEQHNSSMESGSSADDQASCVVHPNACETSMWEEWTQAASTGDDSVSTSSFLPDLGSSVSSRLSFQSDMLSSWMAGFHPLSQPSLSPDHHLSPSSVPPPFLHPDGLALDSEPPLPDLYPPRSIATTSKLLTSEFYPSSLPYPAVLPSPSTPIDDVSTSLPLMCGSKPGSVSRHLRHVLGPSSPSSPLAFQNGLLNPLGDPWDGACHSPMAWTSPGHTYGARSTTTFIPDHSASAIDYLESVATTSRAYGHQGVPACKPRHTDIFMGPNGTFETTPGGWTPQFYESCDTAGSAVAPLKLMASLREAGGHGEASTSGVSGSEHVRFLRGGLERTTTSMSGILADCKRADQATVWPGKHRLELVELVDGASEDGKLSSPPLPKRPKNISVENASALWSDHVLKGAELRSYTPSSGSSLAAQAMDIIAIGPALNTNGKPRARRGSATDPQSVYARHRREKINERMKNLQNLVPNGAKVDIVTMLEEAIHYVKFLQNQLELLQSDELWVYANPNNYNGMDISEVLSGTMVNSESSA